ncbi:MAG: phosphodiesterase [Christensenellaceae bacterium]|jgi:putative phosphoesterase|nr:phosphodiesterase [Christensenellaceae bacterium]
MKYVIGSDLHGSLHYGSLLINRFKAEKACKLILLGDIYYHGPRNPLPDKYTPNLLAEELNKIKDYLIVIKGNCDSEVDQMISDFTFFDSYVFNAGKAKVVLTHGHNYNIEFPPLNIGDILLYGHYHIPSIEITPNGVIAANPGSVALPKNNSKRAYLVLTDDSLVLKELESGKLIDSIDIN